MNSQYTFPIDKNFDYFAVDNFRTKKLEGSVELRKADLPGADMYIVSPKLYVAWRHYGKFPQGLKKDLTPIVKDLVKKFGVISVRTCFRFSGYENPRSLPAFRDITTLGRLLTDIEKAYEVGEKFATENKIEWFDLGLIVMGGVKAEKSAAVLTDYKRSKLSVVEVCWGDIHLISTGEEGYDSYWISSSGKIEKKIIREKKYAYHFVDGKREKRSVPKAKQKSACISDDVAKQIAKHAFTAARYKKSSIEIETLIREDGWIEMYEMQERPGLELSLPKERDDTDGALVSGVPVHGGRVEGKVKIVTDLVQLQEVAPGEILVLPSRMMGEDIPVIGKIGALITDTGGVTAHISTIAKECKVPCIVGTGNASKKLKDGMRVIVDAAAGKIYSQAKKMAVGDLSPDDQVMWLQGLKSKIDTIGAKAANLVALMQLGINVPEAYAISTQAFDSYVKKNSIANDIDRELKNIDVENLGDTEQNLQTKINQGQISTKLEERIVGAFKRLSRRYGKVSVRSSATCEDSRKASFAGQFQSFLFVDDENTLLESVKRCWASLYRAGAVLYATQHGVDMLKTKMAVIIQGMIDAEVAGVMFTKNFQHADDTILIEAAEGIGENVVSGEVTPVTYRVSREGEVLEKNGSDRDMLTGQTIKKLVALGVKIEEAFGIAQDIEWAIKDGEIFILQSRPITV